MIHSSSGVLHPKFSSWKRTFRMLFPPLFLLLLPLRPAAGFEFDVDGTQYSTTRLLVRDKDNTLIFLAEKSSEQINGQNNGKSTSGEELLDSSTTTTSGKQGTTTTGTSAASPSNTAFDDLLPNDGFFAVEDFHKGEIAIKLGSDRQSIERDAEIMRNLPVNEPRIERCVSEQDRCQVRQQKENFFFAMTAPPGKDLRFERWFLSDEERLWVVSNVFAALDENKLRHNDLSPANVVVNWHPKTPLVTLMDFAIDIADDPETKQTWVDKIWSAGVFTYFMFFDWKKLREEYGDGILKTTFSKFSTTAASKMKTEDINVATPAGSRAGTTTGSAVPNEDQVLLQPSAPASTSSSAAASPTTTPNLRGTAIAAAGGKATARKTTSDGQEEAELHQMELHQSRKTSIAANNLMDSGEDHNTGGRGVAGTSTENAGTRSTPASQQVQKIPNTEDAVITSDHIWFYWEMFLTVPTREDIRRVRTATVPVPTATQGHAPWRSLLNLRFYFPMGFFTLFLIACFAVFFLVKKEGRGTEAATAEGQGGPQESRAAGEAGARTSEQDTEINQPLLPFDFTRQPSHATTATSSRASTPRSAAGENSTSKVMMHPLLVLSWVAVLLSYLPLQNLLLYRNSFFIPGPFYPPLVNGYNSLPLELCVLLAFEFSVTGYRPDLSPPLFHKIFRPYLWSAMTATLTAGMLLLSLRMTLFFVPILFLQVTNFLGFLACGYLCLHSVSELIKHRKSPNLVSTATSRRYGRDTYLEHAHEVKLNGKNGVQNGTNSEGANADKEKMTSDKAPVTSIATISNGINQYEEEEEQPLLVGNSKTSVAGPPGVAAAPVSSDTEELQATQ
ncbi:unnamed protein product [Amoebophrya sp. A120]|nr:unnamed protein product [Amoebophrya sp. A120]|eukprot:GSA120T00024983001.1